MKDNTAYLIVEPRLSARTGVVTLIQRFGSALNTIVHLHMLIRDGVYTPEKNGPRFHRVERQNPHPQDPGPGSNRCQTQLLAFLASRHSPST